MGSLRTFFSVILTLAALASPLPAQDLQFIFDPLGCTLCYSKTIDNYVSVQFSTDLEFWNTTYPLDQIQSETEGSQALCSKVGAIEGNQVYFRLLIQPAWNVTLSWDAVPDPQVAGYRVYYRAENPDATGSDAIERRIEVGNKTVTSVSLPIDRRLYHFVVTSYTATGLESERSEEVSVSRAMQGSPAGGKS